MYSVVGPDGKVYGPVDIGTFKNWCAEGRITPDTKIVDPIDGLVKYARDMPEVGQYMSQQRPPTTVRPPAPTQNPLGYDFSRAPSLQHQYQYISGYTAPPKNKIIAILLAFFLGPLGIHRFYMGHTATGVVMLLLTVLTCGYGAAITYIWSIVDIILISIDGLKDSDNRPLTW